MGSKGRSGAFGCFCNMSCILRYFASFNLAKWSEGGHSDNLTGRAPVPQFWQEGGEDRNYRKMDHFDSWYLSSLWNLKIMKYLNNTKKSYIIEFTPMQPIPYSIKSHYLDIFASDTFFLRNKILQISVKTSCGSFPTLIPFSCLLSPQEELTS